MIKEIKGNLLDTHCKLIAHGVNCQGVMGSGVAKALYEKWPEVRENYLQYCHINRDFTPEEFLGKVPLVTIKRKYDEIVVANCFTQQNYGYDRQVYLSYSSMEECLMKLNKFMIINNYKEIAMPKIGCGLAGGNWEKVKEIINEEFHHDITINVYFLE